MWFSDINIDEVNSEIEEISGISESFIEGLTKESGREKLLFDTKAITDHIVSINENASSSYLSFHKQRDEIRTIIDEYYRIRKSTLSNIRAQNNNSIIQELGIKDESVLFFSRLTPSAILNLSKSEIVEIAKSSRVCAISYFEEGDYPQPTDPQTNQMTSMHFDVAKLHDDWNTTGSDIGILVLGGTYCWYPNNDMPFSNPETVYNVFNNGFYDIADPYNVPPVSDDHVNHVVNILKQYAPDSYLFVVNKNNYIDIEWTLEHTDVHIINASVNYGYTNQNIAKWYDIISTDYNVPVIASAGNSLVWAQSNTYNVISPACGYNSIAVGAYQSYPSINYDRMHDFMYNTDLYGTGYYPCYKPDVVVAANDTSTAAPALSGILACVLQTKQELLGEPEIIKAIVMASCHRKVLPAPYTGVQETMTDGLTPRQGAGAVDAYRMFEIANSETYGYSELTTDNTEFVSNLLGSDSSYTLSMNDNLNVSIAWMIKGQRSGLVPDAGEIMEKKQDLSLKVFCGNTLLKQSSILNCGKQMVYLTGCNANDTYTIKVNNITSSNDLLEKKFGYAWSEKGVQEISSVNINGIQAVGQTLNAVVTDSNNTIISSPNIYKYHWQRSIDGGNTWIGDLGISNQYVVTNNDVNSLIRCLIEPLNCSLYTPSMKSGITPTTVFIFGDVTEDGYVDSNDPLIIRRYLSHQTTLNTVQSLAADVDLNGYVDIVDATFIELYLNDEIEELPIIL